jgi:Bifunctional DNA primase/polymerase, N-terminal/Primase C terminal 1 (PriCT-1)
VKGTGKPGDGYTAATRDLAKIRHWWDREFPDAGVGKRLDGHIGIDCDVKDGAPGLESYEFLRDTFDLPETRTQITHSDGRHHVFKLPEGMPAEWLGSWTRVTRPAGLDGIDIKVGKRGLLFAEPTRGSRGFYRWVDPTAEIVTLPHECADFLHEIHCQEEKQEASSVRPRRLVAPVSRAGLPLNIPGGMRDGDGRNDILFRKVACRARRFGASEAEILAKLEEANVRLCSDPLSDRELRKIAASAARYSPGVVNH